MKLDKFKKQLDSITFQEVYDRREEKAKERFKEYFDEIYPNVEFGNLSYPASHVLQEVDPIAFEQEFFNWLDQEGIDLDKPLEETDSHE